jgi:hypothetical protein
MKQMSAFLRIFFIIVTLLVFMQCNEGSIQKSMKVDELMVNTLSLTGETVIVEGLCTHVCSRSGMKLFLQGNDSTFTLRAESDATLGKFDPLAVGKMVRVIGILEEDPTAVATTLHEHGTALNDSTESGHCEEEESAVPTYHIAATSYQILD